MDDFRLQTRKMRSHKVNKQKPPECQFRLHGYAKTDTQLLADDTNGGRSSAYTSANEIMLDLFYTGGLRLQTKTNKLF